MAGVQKEVPGTGATNKQLRGSSLLLVGRILSMGVNFGVQVLLVRYLSRTSYGAFAYALSIVSVGETIATLGLDRAVTRFIPIYDERGERAKVLGTLTLVLGSILALGSAVVLLVFGLQDLFAASFSRDQEAITLLVILIILSPVQALDNVVTGAFAVFAKPRAIFFRRYLLAPGLKLTVVLLLVLRQADVLFLAQGYVAAGALGALLYSILLARLLRQQGVLGPLRSLRLSIPFREVFAFTFPLLTSDLVFVVMNASDAVMLGHFGGPDEVAAFRAVQPAARLNQLAMSSFALLFTPVAARYFARGDRDGIRTLYWRTAIWLAVLTFPVFLATTSLAEPITVTLYGSDYLSSAPYLALLSFGYYFNVALGFNGLTLKVYGRLRYVVVLNVVTAILNITGNLLLIPRYGPLGAAISTCGALIVHNLLKQAGLRLITGIGVLDRRTLRVYGVIAASALAVAFIQLGVQPPFLVGLGAGVLACVIVFLVSRPMLQVGETFPELLRYRLLRYLLNSER